MSLVEMRWGTDINGVAGTDYYALPNPKADGIQVNGDFIGSADRTLDGSLRVDRIAEKKRIIVPWTGLSESEKTTLRNAWDAFAHVIATLRMPEGDTYSVIAASYGWQERRGYIRNGAETVYDITLTFLEA